MMAVSQKLPSRGRPGGRPGYAFCTASPGSRFRGPLGCAARPFGQDMGPATSPSPEVPRECVQRIGELRGTTLPPRQQRAGKSFFLSYKPASPSFWLPHWLTHGWNQAREGSSTYKGPGAERMVQKGGQGRARPPPASCWGPPWVVSPKPKAKELPGVGPRSALQVLGQGWVGRGTLEGHTRPEAQAVTLIRGTVWAQ